MMKSSSRYARGASALVLVGVLCLASACSSSDSGSGGSPTSAGTAGSTGGPGSASSAATGKPITIGTIYSSYIPSVAKAQQVALDAAIQAVNASGGVGGRPLDLSSCSDDGTANAGAGCARGFIGNSSVVSLVGSNDGNGQEWDADLDQAKLPNIGPLLAVPSDYTSTTLFPLNGGPLVSGALAVPACLKSLGKKSISLAYIDLPTGATVITVLNDFVLKPYGKQLSTSVPLPVTSADLSSQAAKIVQNNADCVVLFSSEESDFQLISALKQQGYAGQIFVNGLATTPANLVANFGESGADGIGTTLLYDYSSPMGKRFESQVASYVGNAAKASADYTDVAFDAWLSVQVFVDAAKKSATIDRSTVLKTLQTLTFDTQGATEQPLDFADRKPNPAVLGGSGPNLIDTSGMGAIIKNGVAVPLGSGWLNAFGS